MFYLIGCSLIWFGKLTAEVPKTLLNRAKNPAPFCELIIWIYVYKSFNSFIAYWLKYLILCEIGINDFYFLMNFEIFAFW